MASGKEESPVLRDPNAWVRDFLGYIKANPGRPASLYSEILDELIGKGLVELVPHLTPAGRKALEGRP